MQYQAAELLTRRQSGALAGCTVRVAVRPEWTSQAASTKTEVGTAVS